MTSPYQTLRDHSPVFPGRPGESLQDYTARSVAEFARWYIPAVERGEYSDIPMPRDPSIQGDTRGWGI